MIEARFAGFATIARRLADRAVALASAQAEEDARQARDDPSRWRDPRLLWPLFTKG